MSLLSKLGYDYKKESGSSNYSNNQNQTKEAFGFKWEKRDTYESGPVKDLTIKWLMEKYFDGNIDNLKALLGNESKIILDAGCGSAFSASVLFGNLLNEHEFLGVDISESVNVAAERFKELGLKGEFLQASLVDIPIDDNSIDIIFSEGVLHHTDSTEASIKALTKKLKPGGKILFYVYIKKAVIREFTDDYIREQIRPLSDEQSWEAMYSISKLGIALGKIKAKINIEEDIPLLRIKKGEYDLQRFFYYNICKTFYGDDLNIDEMNHINFDWFRPLNCHRHTPEEIREYCNNAGLEVNRLYTDSSGITVIATKK
jgi:arsenite methyltransferase